MMWLVDNLSLLIVLLAAIVSVILIVKRFTMLPTEDQIKNIKEWLLFAVIQAEKDLGGGTGRLKLRVVYDMFLEKFPWIAKTVPFLSFSIWVDEVLIEMKKILEQNNNILAYVEGD